MTPEEIKNDYEANTGNVIVELFSQRNLSPTHMPAVLVAEHGPFLWSDTPRKAVENAVVLEECACMAYHTRQLRAGHTHMQPQLLDKHYLRKHGSGAYYGQKGSP